MRNDNIKRYFGYLASGDVYVHDSKVYRVTSAPADSVPKNHVALVPGITPPMEGDHFITIPIIKPPHEEQTK
jgi:hypothetical protein